MKRIAFLALLLLAIPALADKQVRLSSGTVVSVPDDFTVPDYCLPEYQCGPGGCSSGQVAGRQPSAPQGNVAPMSRDAVLASVLVEVFSDERSAENPWVAYSQNGMVSGGSGTHIGDGLIITNRHVAEKVGRKAQVIFVRAVGVRAVAPTLVCSGTVVAVCQFADIAAIYCPLAAREAAVDLGAAAVAKGMPVYSAGYPSESGRQMTRKYGVMGDRVQVGRTSRWASDKIVMHSSRGDSGSGIFDKDGNLVGVLWGGDDRQYYDTSACTYEDTKRFVTEYCCNWYVGKLLGRPDPNGPKLPAQPPIASPIAPPAAAPASDPRLDVLIAAIADLQTKVAAIPAGKDGKDGAQGKEGPAGKNGLDGKSGATGPQGGRGDSGPVGAPGPVGPAGPAGPPGSAGKATDPAAITALQQRIDALEQQVSKLTGQPPSRVRVVPVP